jgi:hypothetical protein
MLDSLTFADTGRHNSSSSALGLLTNLKETDKGMIIVGDDWELVDKCVHTGYDLKQNAEIGNVAAVL